MIGCKRRRTRLRKLRAYYQVTRDQLDVMWAYLGCKCCGRCSPKSRSRSGHRAIEDEAIRDLDVSSVAELPRLSCRL